MKSDEQHANSRACRTVIRTATLADLDPILGQLLEFRNFLRQTNPTEGALRNSLAFLLADPGTEFLIASDVGPRIIGYSQLRFRYSAWVSGWEAEIEDLFVTASERGRGIGRQLLAAILAAARRRGCRSIGLTTNEANRAARALYEGAGFRAARARWDGLPQLWLQRSIEP